MSKKNKAFIYQLLSFTIFFIGCIFLFKQFLPFKDFYIKLISFVVATVLAPKFKAIQTKEGEKLLVKIIFVKELKEI